MEGFGTSGVTSGVALWLCFLDIEEFPLLIDRPCDLQLIPKTVKLKIRITSLINQRNVYNFQNGSVEIPTCACGVRFILAHYCSDSKEALRCESLHLECNSV